VRNLLQAVKPDVIFHLSGLVTAVTPLEFVLPTFQSLLRSTVNLLVAATEVGCRRIVLSASLTEPRSSDVEIVPGSPYAAAKWASSVYGRMFHVLYGTPTVIVRPYMAYGPGQNVKKLIPSVTLSLLRGERPQISRGQWRADWIYIDDVVEGYLAAAHIPKIEGSTLDLGTGKLVSVSSVVQQLVQLIAPDIKPIFGVVPDRPHERVCAADPTATLEVLGWKPSVCLEAGLRQTVDWYKAQIKTNCL
jgi:nucleoside-diphosphate-sugar epimerase